jgi:hypothetical protein
MAKRKKKSILKTKREREFFKLISALKAELEATKEKLAAVEKRWGEEALRARKFEGQLMAYELTMVLYGGYDLTAILSQDGQIEAMPTPNNASLANVLRAAEAYDTIKRCGTCKAVVESHTHPVKAGGAPVPIKVHTRIQYPPLPPGHPDHWCEECHGHGTCPSRFNTMHARQEAVRRVHHPTIDDHPDTLEARAKCEMCNPLGIDRALSPPNVKVTPTTVSHGSGTEFGSMDHLNTPEARARCAECREIEAHFRERDHA